MAISFIDGFDSYLGKEFRLPKQPWWRRLLRKKRPPTKLYVCFAFKGQEWHCGEAALEAPEGVDVVDVKFAFYQDGKPMEFDPHNFCIAVVPRGKEG